MRRADADVYYQRTSDSLTGVVAAFCRRYGRRFVFAVGAMADCDPALPNCSTYRERYLYLYGLRRADAVVVQSEAQQRNLMDYFGRPAELIRSTTADPAWRCEPVARPGRPRVVWIGRFVREKRPKLLFEIARRCPEVDFLVIGGSAAHHCVAEARSHGHELKNVVFRGYVPFHQMPACYQDVTALLCTSVSEGFPNTFLEAWSRGIPVVTSVDPDGLVAREGLGVVATEADGLMAGVRRIAMAEGILRADWARRCRAHYQRCHYPDVVAASYETLLTRLVRPSGGTARVISPK